MSLIINPEKRVTLWNKLGNSAEVAKSMIGLSLSENGTITYDPGKFGNGVNFDTSGASNYINLPSDWINKGCIEWWANHNYSWDGTPIGSSSAIYFTLAWNGSIGHTLTYDPGTNRFDIFWIDSAGTGYVVTEWDNNSFSSGTNYHMAIVWDSDGIDGSSDKIRFYWNGSEVSLLSGSKSTAIYASTLSNPSVLGNSVGVIDRPADAIIDNLKIWNYAKTDFSDRNNEYPVTANGTNTYVDEDKKLVLWNKLGNASEVAKSEIGVNGSQTGGTFASAKFGSGFEIDANSEYVEFDHEPGSKGTFECYYKTKYASTDVSVNRTVFDRNNTATRVLLRWATSGQWVYGVSSVFPAYTPSAFSAGDIFHMAVVWDTSGIDGGSDTLRLYIDGVQVSSSTSAFSAPTQTKIRLGNDDNNNIHGNGVIDNFKVHNYAKTDFSDRIYEYPITVNGANTFVKPLEQLLLWNRLGSSAEVTDSDVGNDGVENNSPTYAAAKFGDGLSIPTNTGTSSVETKFDYKGIFTIEFWYKPTYAYNTAPSIITILHSAMIVGSAYIRIGYNNSLNQFFIYVPDNTGTNKFIFWTTTVFAANDLLHIAYVIDKNGINGTSETVQFYLNGVKLDVQASSTGSATMSLYNLDVYDLTLSLGKFIGANLTMDGVMDNIKIHNYAKTDFSDRNVEPPIDLKHVRTI